MKKEAWKIVADAGRKIKAIQLYMKKHPDCGLREAREAVIEYMTGGEDHE